MNSSDAARLPLLQAIIYASGYFGVRLIEFAAQQIPQVLYVPPNGVSILATSAIAGAILFGIVHAIARITDAFIDPVVGNSSDHFRSRFGRRKPFLLVGAPVMGLLLVLITVPPTSIVPILFIYILILYPLYYLFFSVTVTPYLAMLPEITQRPPDRLLVTTLQSVFLIIGSFVGVFVVGMVPKVLSYTWGVAICAILSAIPFMLVVAFVRPPKAIPQEEITSNPGTFSQVIDALSFKPFRMFLFGQVAFWFGFIIVETSAKYIAELLFPNLHNAFMIVLGLALSVAAVASPGAYWMGRKFGKKRSMILMSVLFMVLFPLIGVIGYGPFASTGFGIALFGLIGLPLSLLFIIPNSLLADLIDRDSELTGKHREGLFFAAQSLLDKTGQGVSLVVLNALLSIGATHTTAVGVTGVRLVGPVAAIFMLIGLLIFLRLPDVEKR